MKTNKINLEVLKKAIEMAGGASNFALKVGVSYNTVLNWKNGRNSIPPMMCMNIEKITEGKIRREELLRFPWDNFSLEEKKEEKLKSEIAKNLLAAGVDIDTIAKTTGISKEELENIKS
jgi:DNA-binding transcriptional regulator YdaS (Cro superfamily)